MQKLKSFSRTLKLALFNLKNSQEIRKFCRKREIPVVGMIPFDEEMIKILNLGKPAVEVSSGPAAGAIEETYAAVLEYLEAENQIDYALEEGS